MGENSILGRAFAATLTDSVQIRGDWQQLWRADKSALSSCNPAQRTSVISSARIQESSELLFQQLRLIKSRLYSYESRN